MNFDGRRALAIPLVGNVSTESTLRLHAHGITRGAHGQSCQANGGVLSLGYNSESMNQARILRGFKVSIHNHYDWPYRLNKAT